MTLQQLEGNFISVTVSGCCDSLQGRIFRVDEGKLILIGVLGTRIIPICSISSIDFGPFAYVTNFIDNTVSVINTATNTVIGLPISVGDSPGGIAIIPDGTRAYVVNVSDSTISVINTATNTVIGLPISVGSGASGIAITPITI